MLFLKRKVKKLKNKRNPDIYWNGEMMENESCVPVFKLVYT